LGLTSAYFINGILAGSGLDIGSGVGPLFVLAKLVASKAGPLRALRELATWNVGLPPPICPMPVAEVPSFACVG